MVFLLLMQGQALYAQGTTAKIPFDGMDLTWVNGQNRQTNFPLTLNDKDEETIVTGVAFMDGYYNYNFHKPIDNTHTISSSIGSRRRRGSPASWSAPVCRTSRPMACR